MMHSKIKQMLHEAHQELSVNGVETSSYELKLMLAHVLKTTVPELPFYHLDISQIEQNKFGQMIQARLNHMPADKIIGSRGFYKYDFLVNSDVLSPRPDTEILLEEALSIIRKKNYTRVLELGVGSGCIITSILAENNKVQGEGVDISQPALEIAKKNAELLKVEDRLKLYHRDWFAKDFVNIFKNKFNVIISNPPYIPSKEISNLDEEVKNFDPLYALDGGEDGLDSYRQIAVVAPHLLEVDGHILLEVGEGQAEDVVAIYKKQNFVCEKIISDLSGTNRCIVLKIGCI